MGETAQQEEALDEQVEAKVAQADAQVAQVDAKVDVLSAALDVREGAHGAGVGDVPSSYQAPSVSEEDTHIL